MEDDVDQRQHSSFQLNLTVTTFVCGILLSSTANFSAALCYVWDNLIYVSHELLIQKGNRNIHSFCLPLHFAFFFKLNLFQIISGKVHLHISK